MKMAHIPMFLENYAKTMQIKGEKMNLVLYLAKKEYWAKVFFGLLKIY